MRLKQQFSLTNFNFLLIYYIKINYLNICFVWYLN